MAKYTKLSFEYSTQQANDLRHSSSESACNNYAGMCMLAHAVLSNATRADKAIAGAQFVARLLACSGAPSESTLNILGMLDGRGFQIAFRPNVLTAESNLSGTSERDRAVLRNGMMITFYNGLDFAESEKQEDASRSPEHIAEAQARAGIHTFLEHAVPDHAYRIEVLGYAYIVTLTH